MPNNFPESFGAFFIKIIFITLKILYVEECQITFAIIIFAITTR